MRAVVVVPCLDEEANVEGVGLSLGFGRRGGSSVATLVLVDNGSTDGTVQAMAELADCSEPGAVVVVHEPERGFVPARHRGALEARRLVQSLGLDEDKVVLAQADADTRYEPGYLEALLEASALAGRGALIDGVSEAPPPPEGWAEYRAFERAVDDAVEPAFGNMDQDVVVDDKIAAFRLSDYFEWGGHRREYGDDGEEILSETTRLFIAAKLRGGFRRRAWQAVATTSHRRLFQDPAMAFATAGFPRGLSWRRRAGLTPVGSPSTDIAALKPLVPVRAAHLLGMFGLLPTWFSGRLGAPLTGVADLDVAYAQCLNGAPTKNEAFVRPGALLDWAMSRPDEDVAAILSAARCDLQSMGG